ncbi:MAG: hypothetical protein ACYCPT_02585 [Acidimicrobiales bacterium]
MVVVRLAALEPWGASPSSVLASKDDVGLLVIPESRFVGNEG